MWLFAYPDKPDKEGSMVAPQIDELNLLHAHVCSALGDPTRLLLLYALNDEPQRVSTLAESLDIPQSTVSRHLGVLRQRSLVISERNGMAVVYSLADSRIIDVLDTMRLVLRDALDRQANMLS
jgi:DNA-binding transcriptional ArsR family regulator